MTLDGNAFRGDHYELARIVGGEWESKPSRDWCFERMLPIQALIAQQARLPVGTLVCAKNPAKSLKQLTLLKEHPGTLALLTADNSKITDLKNPVLRVPDVRVAMDNLAVACREAYEGMTIAVTGSVGKTTIRRLIDHTLSSRHSLHTSDLNLNGTMHARRQLSRLKDEEFATFEVARIGLPGAESLIRPNIAVISALGEAHLQDLGSLRNIAQLKAQLIRGVPRGGVAVVNIDSPNVGEVLDVASDSGVRVITYGENPAADIRLVDFDAGSSVCSVHTFGIPQTYSLAITGRHNAVNSLAMLGVLAALDLPIDDYLKTIGTFTARKGRGRSHDLSIHGKAVTLVDESFNANPTSMAAVLSGFAATYPARRRVLVLGDMLELGPGSGEFHAGLLSHVIDATPAKVFLVGQEMRVLRSVMPDSMDVTHVPDSRTLAERIRSDIEDGDAILVKASNGTGLGRVVAALRSQSPLP